MGAARKRKTPEPLKIKGSEVGELGAKTVDVDLYGPVSVLSVIKRVDLVVDVDVSGLKPGTYELPLRSALSADR